MRQKGFVGIIILIAILVIGVGAGAYYLGKSETKSQNQQQLSTTSPQTPPPSIASTPSVSDSTADWKTFTSDKLSISYPSDWTEDTTLTDPTFKSSDYVMSREGFPQNGFIISLYFGGKQFSGSLGLKSTVSTTWMGENATLQNYAYEADDWVLTTNVNGIDYQLVATVATNEIWDNNKDIILKAANSLKLK